MKFLVFLMAMMAFVSLSERVQAETCQERSWIVQVSPETISKDDLISVLVSISRVQNAEVVFHGLWYVLNDHSTDAAPVRDFSLTSTLAKISKLNGVGIYCNETISIGF